MSVSTQVNDTGVSPDRAYTSLQYSDEAESSNVSTLVGHPNLADYVSNGLEIADGSVDWSDGTFDLSEGKAFWLIEEINDRPSDEHSWHQCLFTSYYPSIAEVSFDPSSVQYVFARCDGVRLGDPIDSPKIDVLNDPEPQSDDSILIAELDPSANKVVYHNRNPDGIFDSLEATSVVIHDSLEADGLVDTAALADRAVTNSKVATDAIDQRTIQRDGVGHEEIEDRAVDESDIHDDAVIERTLADNSVTAATLAAESVVTRAILDGAITTSKYTDKSITGPKVVDATLPSRVLKSRSVTPSKLDSNLAYRMAGLTSTAPVSLEAGGRTKHPRGTADGEILRIGTNNTDTIWQATSHPGPNGQSFSMINWNAEYDKDTNDFHRIIDGAATSIGLNGNNVEFRTADYGEAGDPIRWEHAQINNGGIDNAHALGGVAASNYLRKRGVVDISGGEFTLLNDFDSGRQVNTSHDLVFENLPSGERIHMNYARPELRMFQEHQFQRPMWVARRNGMFQPGLGLYLSGGQTPGMVPGVGTVAYYYNNELRFLKDSGERTTLIGGNSPIQWGDN